MWRLARLAGLGVASLKGLSSATVVPAMGDEDRVVIAMDSFEKSSI